jgi:hypothetical protein
MKKSIIAGFTLCAVLLVILAGCGGSSSDSPPKLIVKNSGNVAADVYLDNTMIMTVNVGQTSDKYEVTVGTHTMIGCVTGTVPPNNDRCIEDIHDFPENHEYTLDIALTE